MRRLTAEELQKLLQRRGEALVSTNGKGAEYYAKLVRRIDALILRLLEQSDSTIGEAEAAKLASDIRTILGNGARAVLTKADQDALEVMRLAFDHQADYFAAAYGRASIQRVSVPQVLSAFRYYERRIESGEILRGEYWRLKRQEWTQEFIDEQRKVLRGVQAQITRGLASGSTSPRDVAAALRGPLGGLQISGRMDPEAFAESFTRTQYGQLYNDMSVSISTQAGVEKFVNIGTPDERQSRECYEASQQPPMTMQEWDEWRASNGKGGRPGQRHVMNCRCIAGGVPAPLEEDDWTQPNPKYEEANA